MTEIAMTLALGLLGMCLGIVAGIAFVEWRDW